MSSAFCARCWSRPCRAALILLGKVLGGATVATLHGALVLILARFADVTMSIEQMAVALLLMFVLAFGLTSFGVILAARVRSFEGFGVFSNTVILPLYFTSSSIFPLDPALTRAQQAVTYPEWLVFLVQINPITYAVDALRGVLINFNQFTPYWGPDHHRRDGGGVLHHRDDRFRPAMTLRTKRWLQVAINLAVVVVLLFAVSFLPPDTSLADRRRAGVLKLCVPPSYPPLVTGDPAKPGFDVELVAAIATQMGLKLLVNTVTSIGSDFNPRNWSLTRGQCDVVAGGVADTAQTRSFLETIPTPAETGWVGISATGRLPEANGSVAVLPGTSGLDRLQLSGWLREQALRVVPTRTPAAIRRCTGERPRRSRDHRAFCRRDIEPWRRSRVVLAARGPLRALPDGIGPMEGRPDAEACHRDGHRRARLIGRDCGAGRALWSR